MKRRILSLSVILGLFAISPLVLAPTASAQERVYTTVAPPGARSSTAFGINSGGAIVGTFVDQGFVQHGFLLGKNGEYTVIDYPGARSTIARGINPRGDIVGSYQLPGDPGLAARGFLLTKEGEYQNVRFPGHTWEIAQRILPNGAILGCRHDQDQMETMRGIMIGSSGPSEIEAFGSMNNGATPDLRLIVGFWFNMMDDQQQSYTIEDGVFTSFMVPGSDATNAWDVNPDRMIVGVYAVGTTVRGFLRSGDNYTTIHYPGANVTRAFGINPRGDIVGAYVMGGVTRAYLAREVE